MPGASQQVDHLAETCLQSLLAGTEDWMAPADQLAQLAAREGDVAPASRAIFAGIVEPLADRFEPRLVEAYRRLFARILTHCDWLQSDLADLGLADEQALVERAERIAVPQSLAAAAGSVQRIIIPSRVTVGADVALTLRAIRRTLDCCPKANIHFWGGESSASLLPADPRIRFERWDYPRRGGLRARLDAWRRMSRRVADLWNDSAWLIDLDTRWSQAGMLPLTPDDERLLFWESRSFRPESPSPLSQLADEWLDRSIGQTTSSNPVLDVPATDVRADQRPIAVVNFGVGGNEAKRIGESFEVSALEALRSAGFSVILDQGFGSDERQRAERLAKGGRAEVRRTSIRELAALIRSADLYLGYDSAGGHIAAALGTRGFDLFAGAVTPRMVHRWSPWGERAAEVIAVGRGDDAQSTLDRLRERLG